MSLKFGIELESMGLTGNEVKAAVEAAGEQFGGLFGYRGGTGCVDRNEWRAESDSSLSQAFCTWNTSGSHEIISPIMQGVAGRKAILRVVKKLNQAGATVDRSCGTHIHVGVGHSARWARMSEDKKMEIGARMIEIYTHFMPVFDALSPNNRTCRGNSYVGVPSWNSRYSAVNLQAFVNYGRVEFRQPGFTLNQKVIEMWLGLVDSICKAAVNENHRSYHVDVAEVPVTLPAMLEFLNVGTKVTKLATDRLDFCIEKYTQGRERRIAVRGQGVRNCICCGRDFIGMPGQNICGNEGCE
tara:strand:+ start:7287 stop:8180 length:894 start_codon:yes stop_codon:yes gene_type:complete